MTHQLFVAPRAEADLRDAFIWYGQRSSALAEDLMRQVEARLELLRHSPQVSRKRFGPYRLAPTKRFPYAIYYIWDETNHFVMVRRILHFCEDSPPKI